MGAIFTAGGLVVALASIVAVLTVEDRVQRAFAAQMPQVVEQADQQIEAYLTFLEARWGNGDWRYQLRLANQAIQQHPRLRYKVRSYMARRSRCNRKSRAPSVVRPVRIRSRASAATSRPCASKAFPPSPPWKASFTATPWSPV